MLTLPLFLHPPPLHPSLSPPSSLGQGGRTNITYNCLDRWVAAGRGNQVAFLWEGNDLGHERAMTYQQVREGGGSRQWEGEGLQGSHWGQLRHL